MLKDLPGLRVALVGEGQSRGMDSARGLLGSPGSGPSGGVSASAVTLGGPGRGRVGPGA